MAYPPTADQHLFTASQHGDEAAVAMLLRAGARPTASDPVSTWTALGAALIGGHTRVAEALLDAGAGVRTTDRRGNGALHACAAGATATDGDEVGLAIARRILVADPSPDAVGALNHEGVTPLHLAAQRGKRELLTLLADFGAPLGAKDRAGRDAYHYRSDAATERTLLRLISEAALRTEVADTQPPPPGRVAALPWNVVAEREGPSVPPRMPAKPPSSSGTSSALKPPPTVAAPEAPALTAAAQKGTAARSRASSRPASSADTARSGRVLTAAEERRASYLAAYLAPAPLPGSPTRPKKPVVTRASSIAPAAPPEPTLSLEDKLKRAFRIADTDGSKSVSKRELFKALEKVGVSAFSSSEGLKLFQEADINGDGQLTFDEFARLARKLRPLLDDSFSRSTADDVPLPPPERTLSKKTRQQLRRAFAAFDADGSGWISISELSGALRRCGMYVGDEQLRKMFDEADEDRSGGIDVAEFETLVERLMAPSRLVGRGASKRIPPPSAGSATATVFSAFAKGSTGFMATRELPHALRLLGIDPEEPPIVAAIEQAASATRGVLGRQAFSVLVHRLLRRDFFMSDAPSGAPAAAPAPPSAPARALHEPSVDEIDPRKRLARLFVLCDSQEDGSIAARDVPELLWRAGLVADPTLLPALAPKPEHASARVPFERLLAIAFGGPSAAEATNDQVSSVPALQLVVHGLTLAPWLIAHEAVHAVCVVVRAGMRSAAAVADASPAELVPIVLRSATVRKHAASMPLDLEVLLPRGTAFVHLELLHEDPMHGASAVLARAELELSQLYASTSSPVPFTLPLFDARAVQAGTLELIAMRSVEAAPQSPALPSRSFSHHAEPKRALDAVTAGASEVAALEAEVMSLRARTVDLQRQRDVMSVALRAEQRIHGGGSDVLGELGGGVPNAMGTMPPPSTQDWRLDSANALARTLGHLQRRNHDGSADGVAALLHRSARELAALAHDAALGDGGRPSPQTIV